MLLVAGVVFKVSILARPVGRALLLLLIEPSSYGFVSILARPVGRALRKQLTIGHGCVLFQSSPVLWDGRYIRNQLSSGRSCVSILARPVGRALRLRQISLVVA